MIMHGIEMKVDINDKIINSIQQVFLNKAHLVLIFLVDNTSSQRGIVCIKMAH